MKISDFLKNIVTKKAPDSANSAPPTTIRQIFIPEKEDDDESWCPLSQTYQKVYGGKINKYFEVNEDMTGFKIRSGELGLELKETVNDGDRGYAIVGGNEYSDKLEEMKEIYRQSYDELKFSKEFDNNSDRAGFYWEGKGRRKSS